MKQFEGNLDQALEDLYKSNPVNLNDGLQVIFQSSQAISLKRIADTLDEFLKMARMSA